MRNVHLSPGYPAFKMLSFIQSCPLRGFHCTYIPSITSPPLPLTVDPLEERCESFKKDLHNRNIDLVKKHQVLKKESTLKINRCDSRK